MKKLIPTYTSISLILIVFVSILFASNSVQAQDVPLYKQKLDTLHLSYDDLKNDDWYSFPGYWRYKAGDNPAWAEKGFDDSNWDWQRPIAWTNSDISWWNGVGWFRTTLTIDDDFPEDFFFGSTVFLRGASEVYINGKLWRSFGKPSNKADDEILYRNFEHFPIDLKAGNTYDIAVRYSNHQFKKLRKVGIYTGYQFIVAKYDSFLSNRKLNYPEWIRYVSWVIIGFSAGFLLLYLVIFWLNPKDKFNLAYIILLLFYMASLYMDTEAMYMQNIQLLFLFNAFSIVMVVGMHISLLFLCYQMTKTNIPLFSYGILAVGAFIILQRVWFLSAYIWLVNAFYIAIYIEMARSMYMAKKQDSGTSIIAVGGGIALVIASTALILNITDIHILDNVILSMAGYWGVLAVIVAMAIYLAQTLTSTNKALQKKLIEVKELSDKNLQQQKREAELELLAEKEKNRAQVAELQAKALEMEDKRKSLELEEARRLQLSMLPAEIPVFESFELASKMITASEVGGDYYDYKYFPDEDRLLVAFGDATGHGLSAGTIVTATKTLFQLSTSSQKPSDILHFISGGLRSMEFKKLFMSLCILSISKDEIVYANAGMPPLYIFRADNQQIEEEVIKGMPLGSVRSFPYQQKTIQINTNDYVVMLSDGFTELFNEKKEMLPAKAIKDVIKDVSAKQLQPEEIITHLHQLGSEWTNIHDAADDVTMMVIKRKN